MDLLTTQVLDIAEHLKWKICSFGKLTELILTLAPTRHHNKELSQIDSQKENNLLNNKRLEEKSWFSEEEIVWD